MTFIHLSELQIDQLARDSSQSAINEKSHLDSCAGCREKLEFLRTYYHSLENELANPISERVEKLSWKLSKANIIQFTLYQPHVDVNKLTGKENTIVLAAQHIAEDTSRFVTVATFASEPTRTLVRVVEDRFENKYRIHVLAENPILSQFVLVGIVDDSGRSSFLPTNEQGIASLSSNDSIEWKHSGVTVHLPSAILPFDEGVGRITDGDFSLILHRESNMFKATISSSTNEHVRFSLFLFKDDSTLVKEVHSHQITVPLSSNQPISEIRLFS